MQGAWSFNGRIHCEVDTGEESQCYFSCPIIVAFIGYAARVAPGRGREKVQNWNELQDRKRMGEVRIKRLEEHIKTRQKQLFANGGDARVVTQMTRLSSLGNRSTDMLFTEEKTGAQSLDEVIGSRDVKRMAEELKMLEIKFNSQREYNAELLSKMLHLQGNIQVYCCIRPMSMFEVQNNRR